MSLEIIGYADRMSVRPGETIEFKVSCEAGAVRYQARIVRLICGDDRPEGPGFKARPVGAAVDGDYPGRRQPIRTGSCIIVPPAPALDRLESFILRANIWPTSPAAGTEQILIGRRRGDAGFALVIGPAGDLVLRLGEQLFATGTPLHARQWYAAEARYDAGTGRVEVSQTPLDGFARDESAARTTGRAHPANAPADASLVMGEGYNGKIEAPRLIDPDRGIVGQWDFSQGIGGTHVADLSGNGLHGKRSTFLPAA